MAITRWDPLRDVLNLQQRMNSLLQGVSRNPEQDDLLATSTFVPPVNIYEDEHHVILKLDTPGIRQEDLDIQVENDTLTVRGERKFDKDEKEENFHRIEHHYGSFYRAFRLPNTVDSSKVNAQYDNGVLSLTFEKRAEAKPKQIKVNIGPTSVKEVEGAKQQPIGKTA